MKTNLQVHLGRQYNVIGTVRNGYTSDAGPQNRYATLDIIGAGGSLAIFTSMGVKEMEQFVDSVRAALGKIEKEIYSHDREKEEK